MAFVMFNNNPYKKQVGDCSIRAISKALNQSWETSYIDLASHGFFMKDMPSSNAVISSYLHSKGFRRYAISNLCPDCYTFKDFAREHNKGIYILCTGTHIATVIDGVIYDSWQSENEVPIFYWKKEN